MRVETDDKSGRLGQVAAARRVTRSIFMCSAPKGGAAQVGVDTKAVYLSSVQPGESVGPFSDVLRLVSQQAVHLYSDASQYWYSTQPNLNRRAADLAQQLAPDDVLREVERRLSLLSKKRGVFAGVHVTASPAEVPDEPREPSVRLVILPLTHPHGRGSKDSAGLGAAHEIVTRKGGGDRLARNSLVLLVADAARLGDLLTRTRQFLAWSKIHAEAETLNLTPIDKRQAAARVDEHTKGTDLLLGTTYSTLLIPELTESKTVSLGEVRMNGEGELVERATKKLITEGALAQSYGGLPLSHKLDTVLWNERPHIPLQTLMGYFAQYLYLDRLQSAEVLLGAVREGVSAREPYFAYADGVRDGHYLNLRFGESANVRVDDQSVLVNLAAAQAQRERKQAASAAAQQAQGQATAAALGVSGAATATVPNFGGDGISPAPPAAPRLPTSVHVEGQLDQTRMVKRFGDIYTEVVQQLIDAGGEVTVEVIIRAKVPQGLGSTHQRNVLENAYNLGLSAQLE